MSDLKLTLDCRHGIKLLFNREPLLKGKHIFPVHNLLNRCRKQKEKGLDFLSYLVMGKVHVINLWYGMGYSFRLICGR